MQPTGATAPQIAVGARSAPSRGDRHPRRRRRPGRTARSTRYRSGPAWRHARVGPTPPVRRPVVGTRRFVTRPGDRLRPPRRSRSVDNAVTGETSVGSSRNAGVLNCLCPRSPWVHDPPRFHPHLGTTLWMDRLRPVDGWPGIRGQLCGEPGMNRGRMDVDAVGPPLHGPVNGCPHPRVPSRRGLLTSTDALHPHCAQDLVLLRLFSLYFFFPRTPVWTDPRTGVTDGDTRWAPGWRGNCRGEALP